MSILKRRIISMNAAWLALAALFLVGGCGEAKITAAPKAHFYFAQITDTHFGAKDAQERTQKAVEKINGLPMDIQCVAVTGDVINDKITDPAVRNSALETFGKLKAPVHFLPGNHDITDKNRQADREIFEKDFGKLISSAEYQGVVFIFVYTEPLRKSFEMKDYRPLAELEAHLKAANGKPVIVFHHAPSVDDFYGEKIHPGWKKAVRDPWVKLLNDYNVRGVIAGHFHRDEVHWLGNVPLYVSAPIIGYWGRQITFRIYEYTDGKIGYRTLYLE